jgi:hypothetical protein
MYNCGLGRGILIAAQELEALVASTHSEKGLRVRLGSSQNLLEGGQFEFSNNLPGFRLIFEPALTIKIFPKSGNFPRSLKSDRQGVFGSDAILRAIKSVNQSLYTTNPNCTRRH